MWRHPHLALTAVRLRGLGEKTTILWLKAGEFDPHLRCFIKTPLRGFFIAFKRLATLAVTSDAISAWARWPNFFVFLTG